MALVNLEENLVTMKIVYFGPHGSGKTSNLVAMDRSTKPEKRGALLRLDRYGGETVFFDRYEMFTKADTLNIVTQFFSTPSISCCEVNRRNTLVAADAIVFVADSSPEVGDTNAQYYQVLMSDMGIAGLNRKNTPIIIQFNKRDIEGAVSDHVLEKHSSDNKIPFFTASARDGIGVTATACGAFKKAWERVDWETGILENLGIQEQNALISFRECFKKDSF